MLCAKFGWNWLSGSGEEDFFISWMYFYHFVIISPLKGRGPLFKKNLIPFTQWCFVLSLVEIGPGVLEKKIFKFVNLFLLFPNYLPFGKAMALHLKKLESPLPRDTNLVKIGPVVLEKKMKMWKVYRQTDGRTDGQTDDGRQVIRKAHLSFQLRWANN